MLNKHFAARSHQGADPLTARVLFVGLGANYSADIESSPIFPSLLRYHRDGPALWRDTGVHHPFRLPQYRGDGRRYPLNFAKLGFMPQPAEQVSFVELLHVPTVGRSALQASDLSRDHLHMLRRAIFDGRAQLTFVSAGVQRLLVATGVFPELARVVRTFGALRVLHDGEDRAVFLHVHLSNYGRSEQPMRQQAADIAGLLTDAGAYRTFAWMTADAGATAVALLPLPPLPMSPPLRGAVAGFFSFGCYRRPKTDPGGADDFLDYFKG